MTSNSQFPEPVSLFWFRRDLRIHDNTGLAMALNSGKTVCGVFIFDQHILSKLQDKDDRRLNFIYDSLQELKKQFEEKGSQLVISHGEPEKLIPLIASTLEADDVYTNRDYEAYALKRDEQVQAFLNQANCKFHTYKDHIIFESTEVLKANGSPYTVFTPYKRTWLNTLEENLKEAIGSRNSQVNFIEANLLKKQIIQQKLEKKGIPLVNKIEDLGFSTNTVIVKAGSSAANQQLELYLEDNIFNYKTKRDFPALSGTSNLSVHLRFGTLSIRECLRKIRIAKETLKLETLKLEKLKATEIEEITNKQIGLETWLSELIWREFYSMILQAFPHVEKNAFRKEYQNMLWRVDNQLLEAWKQGKTGYPIVDAGMRQLLATGQMHNRVRMIVASFLTKDLLLDWKEGESHFARYLLDFELASNNGGWQWASSTGTDPVPYFRIFNPLTQSEKFDPEAQYIKKYIPELEAISAKDIHKLTFNLPNYPKPIVKRELVKNAVLELFKSAKAKIDRQEN